MELTGWNGALRGKGALARQGVDGDLAEKAGSLSKTQGWAVGTAEWSGLTAPNE